MANKLQQQLFDLLWRNDTPQGAAQAAALSTTERRRDHTLWIAVSCQNTGAVNVLRGAGTSLPGRIGALSLVCSGLLLCGTFKDMKKTIGLLTLIPLAMPAPADRFWGEAEQATGDYLSKGGEDTGLVKLIPALLDDVPSDFLSWYIKALNQATSKAIKKAQSILQAEIDRRKRAAVSGRKMTPAHRKRA